MAIRSAPLNILTFPQRWEAGSGPGDEGRMRVRYLCFPRVDPDVPLAPGHPAFADVSLAFEARIIPTLARLPNSPDVAATIGGAAGAPLNSSVASSDKAALFAALAAVLDVGPRPTSSPGAGPPKPRRILKPETASWRARAGASARSRFLIDKHAAHCAIHESMAAQPELPPRPQTPVQLRWGAVMALCLRTEPLARALGLLGEFTIEIDPDLLRDGGWIVIALHPSSAYAADPALVSLQAARVPPLENSQSLYSAALFPLDQSDYVADDAIREAQLYAGGFARRVHVAQAFDEDDDEDGRADGDCIHIAWDDAQVAEWLNRQSDPNAGTPMGTIGYRVDVRDVTGGGTWHSLQAARNIRPLAVGAVELGDWEGERSLEVVPLHRGGDSFWLPAYFATWRGSSLALTDPDFMRLQRSACPCPVDAPQYADHLVDREKTFAPVGPDAVPLRYGRRYAFRVRLADLTHGGPPPDAETPPDPDDGSGFVAELDFRRFRRPGPVEIRKLPSRAEPTIVLSRPRLRFPELRFAGAPLLSAEADEILTGKPDPDVTSLQLTLAVRALSGDRDEWQPLYTIERAFTSEEITLRLAVVDVPDFTAFAEPGPADDLPVPAGRDLKLVTTPLGWRDAGYFAEGAHIGVDLAIPLEAAARAESPLIALPDEPLAGFFLRQPAADEAAPRPLDLLAEGLGLTSQDLMLQAPLGVRTILACGAALRHTPSPDGHFVQFASDADLRQRWINMVSFVAERDWSWRGLATKGLVVERSAVRAGEPAHWLAAGQVTLPPAIAREALPLDDDPADPARASERQSTRVIFLDAVNPLEIDGDRPPAELEIAYRIVPPFDPGIFSHGPTELPKLRLPVTAPPRQHPKLVSAGIALSPFQAASDYSATEERRRQTWLEFEKEPFDPGDGYFARILAVAPDPLLAGLDAGVRPIPEPALPLEAEWIRRIVPGQSRDESGIGAMPSILEGGRDGRYVLLPLPLGMDPEAPELAGMFTYELRLGHADERWCTAHGRWGPPLRIAGVQHPPPPLRCEAARGPEEIHVLAPFSTPVHDGKPIPRRWQSTSLWAVLYARVRQADAKSHRNVLLAREEMRALRPDNIAMVSGAANVVQGAASFTRAEIAAALKARGLPEDQPLTTLAVEFYNEPRVGDPAGGELGEARIFRTSPLIPVPDAC